MGTTDAQPTGLADIATDENLRGWAAAHGLDVTDRDQLIRSAAVGLTITLWRNTCLEDVHADRVDRATDDIRAHWAAVDAGVDRYTAVADPLEHDRLRLILNGIDSGRGIPDDVMFRANASTASQIRSVLAERLPDDVTEADAEHDNDPEAVPDYLAWVHSTLDDPSRILSIGAGHISAGHLLGPEFTCYTEDLVRKLGPIVRFTDLIGLRRTLWYVALSGATYAGEWYPHPTWPDALMMMRDELAAGRVGNTVLSPKQLDAAPDANDDQYWHTAAERPFTLNARQADWPIASRIGDYTRMARDRRAHSLAPIAREGFNALAALF